MTQEEFREQRQQICQQYRITEEQLDAAVVAFGKLWEAVKEIADKIMAVLQEFAESFRESMQQADLSALSEAIEAIQGMFTQPSPPSYSLADTKRYNAMQRQKLKSYKNRIGSAAIKKPRGVARSCC